MMVMMITMMMIWRMINDGGDSDRDEKMEEVFINH